MGTNLALNLVPHALVKLFLRPADFHSACQNSANNTTVCFGFDDQDSLLSVSPILHLAHAILTLCRCSRWHFASVQSVLSSGLLPGCGNSGADVLALSLSSESICGTRKPAVHGNQKGKECQWSALFRDSNVLEAHLQQVHWRILSFFITFS